MITIVYARREADNTVTVQFRVGEKGQLSGHKVALTELVQEAVTEGWAEIEGLIARCEARAKFRPVYVEGWFEPSEERTPVTYKNKDGKPVEDWIYSSCEYGYLKLTGTARVPGSKAFNPAKAKAAQAVQGVAQAKL